MKLLSLCSKGTDREFNILGACKEFMKLLRVCKKAPKEDSTFYELVKSFETARFVQQRHRKTNALFMS